MDILITILIALATAALCGWLNAVRGGGGPGWLRPVIGIAAGLGHYAITFDPIGSAIIAGGLWAWFTQPWGRWYCLGEGERGWSGPPIWWERQIESIADRVFPPRSGRADGLAWLLSGTVFALPLIILSSPWWLLLTPGTVAIYAFTIRELSIGPHVRAGEIWKGVLIGLIAVLLAGCATPQREPDWAEIAHETGRIVNR